jgi:hypothetical protein
VLSLRTQDGYDFGVQLSPSSRRNLERADGVTIGHAQLRIDLAVAGDAWRDTLVQALQSAAGEAA